VATLRTDFGVVNVTEKRKRRSKSVGSTAPSAAPHREALLTPSAVIELFRAHKKPMYRRGAPCCVDVKRVGQFVVLSCRVSRQRDVWRH
jgi:hypothetical protein